jgi:hypothetical protein
MAHEIPIDIQERPKARLIQAVYQNEADILHDALDALDEAEQDKLAGWNERNRLASDQSMLGLSKPYRIGSPKRNSSTTS